MTARSTKQRSPVRRVAAIHDLSGFGRTSLTVVIPVLSSMGFQVCPLPTAVLSTNSTFPGYHFADLTDHLPPIIRHWRELELEFAAIYSGFLGSARQIAMVQDVIASFQSNNPLVVIDPVLGDNGKLYDPFGPEMVTEMRNLIRTADVITPNITEAALLLDRPVPDHFTSGMVREWMESLAGKGPDTVILTSVPDKTSPETTAVTAFHSGDNRIWKVGCEYLPVTYPGTGDTFASVIVGSLLQGDSLPIALDRAVRFISLGVRAAFGYPYDPREGILLERILPTLDAPVQISGYEVID